MKRRVKWWYVLGCVALVGVGFFSGHYAGAASGTPGTAGDPLITLSYLEGRLAGQNSSGEKVRLTKGQVLVGSPGTNLIVLGGSVTAAGSGLVDVTQGTAAEENTSLFLYHSYIVTEEDTGCEALSGCTVFVCGEYEMK